MRKAQITTELIILLSIVFVMFLVILSTLGNRTEEYKYHKRLMDAKKISEKTANQINMVFLSGPGTQASINNHEKLSDGTNYTINIYPKEHFVEIIWMSKENIRQHKTQIITSNITGDLTGLKGNINISNIKGEILIEN